MRVLIIGNGAREHALAWCMANSPKVDEVFAAPGNAGIADIGTCVPIESSSIVELADFAEEVGIGLTIVGPELPLTLGVVDEFRRRDLTIVGPSQAAAEVEASKFFAKGFLRDHGIPTADFDECETHDEVLAALDRRGERYPVVLKADGLAGGKGVFIARDRGEALEAADRLMLKRQFGKSGERVLVEDHLVGKELSFQVITDGKTALPLAVARDYKRALDGDQGPNTGGMGSISPTKNCSAELGMQIMQNIVKPTLAGLNEDGRSYTGILYVGLILTEDGPKVLEYNARLGDPETQSVLPRLETDAYDLFAAAASGHLDEIKLTWKKEISVSVVLASEGYPGSVTTGREISGLDKISRDKVRVFHAGTEAKDGTVQTSAGRVVTVNASSRSRARAIEKVYDTIKQIRFEGMQFRTDIGQVDGPPEADGEPQ